MAPELNLVWLQSGGCGGCSMALIGAGVRDLYGTLADAGVRVLWHPAFSEQTGSDALRVLERCASGEERLDILCVEGAVLRGPNRSGRFHMLSGTGEPMMAWIDRLARRAKHVVAVGTCAAYGGVSAAGANVTDACGLQYEGEFGGGLLGAEFRGGAGMPVVNVAGCPANPGWIVESLMAIGTGSLEADDIDALGRPRFYADHLVHHGCPRNEYYEFKASAQKTSDLGCLMENLGCKGTQAHGDCNTRPWYGNGSCVRGGFACISCTEPGFEEPGHPFHATPKLAGIPMALPTDMPKAWFVALAALSKSATPKRVRENAVSHIQVVSPPTRKPGSR